MGHKDIITSLLALVLMIIIACDTSIDSQDNDLDASIPEPMEMQLFYANLVF